MIDFNELAEKDLDIEADENEIIPGPAIKAPKARVSTKKVTKPPPPPIDHRLQVLVLHGRQSNENLVNFQVSALKREFGKEVDVKFVEGDVIWVYRDGVDNHDADPMSVTLSKGKDFKTWFNHTTDDKRDRVDFFKQQDPSVKVTYEGHEAAVDKVLNYIENEGPVDVIISVFEGTLVVNLMIAKLVKEGKPIPWRASIMFSPLAIRDDTLTGPMTKEKVKHPVVMVFGKTDEYHYYQRNAAGRVPAEEYYEDPVILEHNDGHQLPATQPRAAEIFARAVAEAKYQCGLLPEAPKRVMMPSKPTSMVLKNLEDMTLRKVRVLCLTGGHSNIPVIKFQTNQLKMALGRDNAEFVYLEGTKDWSWYEGEPKVSDMEERIAGGKQLKNWYIDRIHEEGGTEKEILGYKAHVKTDRENKDKQFDPTSDVEYFDIDAVVEDLISYIYKEGPFDVIVGFSQGGIFLHLLIAYLRKKEVGGREKYPDRWQHARHSTEQMPWRISVFFNAMHVRDKRYFHLFDKKLEGHPTVFVYGKEDEYYEYARDGFGNKPQEEYYDNPLCLVHDQSHEFPTQMPRAKQIYDKVVAQIWRHCGGKPIV
eukprot:CAMPEP_0171178484 /NCGR_PEP_ID=MMETSP0790-20130122/12774_1 /TAXON_ID=2925 /ORGANISM="Alexandrium catenella, Strain OF101" /LENGTH=591 /DNA_ID=CAMNT_0011643405 /DNA_START=81 /DNA_END=1856 /DNA_ORIENTATION=+